MKSIYANRPLNTQTFGTIFGELNPPSYCWNDLMEATDGYCRKGEEEYRYISEMEMALQSREEQGKCNPLLKIVPQTEDIFEREKFHIQKCYKENPKKSLNIMCTANIEENEGDS